MEDNCGRNQTEKLLNMKLRHVGITVMTIIKQPPEFHYFIDILYSIKFRGFNLRVSYISRVLNFAIFSKSRNLALAKLSGIR